MFHLVQLFIQIYFKKKLENLFLDNNLPTSVPNAFPMRVQNRDTENRIASMDVVSTLLLTLNWRLVTRKQLLYVQMNIFEPFRENLV